MTEIFTYLRTLLWATIYYKYQDRGVLNFDLGLDAVEMVNINQISKYLFSFEYGISRQA